MKQRLFSFIAGLAIGLFLSFIYFSFLGNDNSRNFGPGSGRPPMMGERGNFGSGGTITGSGTSGSGTFQRGGSGSIRSGN